VTEAHIRLGWFLHRVGRHQEAIAMLDAAPGSAQDPALTFLRHLFKGHAFVAMDRLNDAIVEYRMATQAVPGAQSARVALMSALTARGDSGQAQAIGQQIETSPPVGDPWWNYWLGDYRFYATALETLRALNSERR
jgi:Tfp pilus assembly protein PilF